MAILSHDLRSPLSAIIGTAKYLKENFHKMKPDAVQEMLELIYKSHQHHRASFPDTDNLPALDSQSHTQEEAPHQEDGDQSQYNLLRLTLHMQFLQCW